MIPEDFAEAIDKKVLEVTEKLIPSYRILVIGDLMLDVTYSSNEIRDSFEQGEPILTNPERTVSLGGAANLAKLFKQLGCDVTLAGVVGTDGSGAELLGWVESEGIFCGNIRYSNRKTTTKNRVLCRNKHIVRFDYEDTGDISDKEVDYIVDGCIAGHEYDMVVFSDYNKGVCTPALIRAVKDTGMPFSVDPKYKHWELYAGATIFKPNEDEFNHVLSQMLDNDFNKLAWDFKNFIVTNSKQNVTLYMDGQNTYSFPVPQVVVTDSCGAGDLFMVVLVKGYLDLGDIEEAIKRAIIITAKAVTQPGICDLRMTGESINTELDSKLSDTENLQFTEADQNGTTKSNIHRQGQSDQQVDDARAAN